MGFSSNRSSSFGKAGKTQSKRFLHEESILDRPGEACAVLVHFKPHCMIDAEWEGLLPTGLPNLVDRARMLRALDRKREKNKWQLR